MTDRTLFEESDSALMKFGRSDMVKRRLILKETLNAFDQADPSNHYQQLATENLKRWKSEVNSPAVENKVQVIAGDWGDVTRILTKKYGTCFAVLNMANAYIPGGGYVEGLMAQEENMFRRTDCHFRITSLEYDKILDQYTPEMTTLLSGQYGVVYLDKEYPRVCIRGPENRLVDNLGYEWLPESKIFPFYELRASAQDLRNDIVFNASEARKRIEAQLDTMRLTGIRFAVLGAFGCGAFLNPAEEVACIYKEEIKKRADDFDLIAFAIFNSGYGNNNYLSFSRVFETEE